MSRSEFCSLAFCQEVISFLDPVPSLVAVHGVEPSAYAGHLAAAFLHVVFKFFYEALSAARIGIPSVHEAVHENPFQTALLCGIKKTEKMFQRTVHSTPGNQAQEMQVMTLFGIIHHGFYLLVLKHLVLAANLVDLNQVLIYNPSGSYVQVPHLGVSHLAVRKPHVLSAGHQLRVRIFCPEGVYVRLTLGIYSVGFILSSQSPSVEDHK